MKNKLLKIFSVIISLSFAFNMFVIFPKAQETQQNIESEISAVQAERLEKEKLLQQLKGDASKLEEYVKTLYEQIDAIQEEIDLYQVKINSLSSEVNATNAKIESTDKEIKDVESQMADKKEDIEEVKEELAVRMRAVYMAGDSSNLKLIINSSDLATLLTTSEMLKRLSENDDKIIKSLTAKIQDLLNLENELANKKESLKNEKANFEAKKQELEKEQAVVKQSQDDVSMKYSEAYKALEQLDKDSEFYKNQILALDKEEERLDQLIKDIITNNSKPNQNVIPPTTITKPSNESTTSSNKPTESTTKPPVNDNKPGSTPVMPPTSKPSGYINPVPYGDAYISSVYGMRTNPVTGQYKLHAGVDICCSGAGGETGPFTKKVVAAKSGTVSHAGWVSGYGNTVMITHSDGYVTLYAHNYSLNVSVGQTVTQGQQISIMGNTGNSKGAHCHFEIRDGMWGNAIDPQPHIT